MSVGSIRRKWLTLPAALVAVFAVGAVAAAPAFASGRPLLETKPATVIRGTEATLNAVVNANGVETKYYFEYGLKKETKKYEHKTAEVSTPASETNIQGSKAISELTAKTEYRFRVVATNSNGTTDGEEATFTTVALAKPEFELGTGEKFTVALEGSFPGAESKFSDSGGEEIFVGRCVGAKSTGSITGAKALSLTVTLSSCKSSGGDECRTEGAEPKEEVFPGNASLVYISKEKKEVGALWEPKTVVVCGGFESFVRGSVVIPVTPINTKTSKVDWVIKGNGKGKPNVTSYENEKGEVKKAKLEVESVDGSRENAMEVNEELDLTASKLLTVSG